MAKCVYCEEYDCAYCYKFAASLPKQLNLEAKRWLVISRMTNKYQDILLIPRWTDAELVSIGEHLRHVVIEGLETQRIVSAKLKALRRIANRDYELFQSPTRGKRGPGKPKFTRGDRN